MKRKPVLPPTGRWAAVALVLTGVFRPSRHPMYLGFPLILLGLTILLGSLTPFIVIPIFAV